MGRTYDLATGTIPSGTPTELLLYGASEVISIDPANPTNPM